MTSVVGPTKNIWVHRLEAWYTPFSHQHAAGIPCTYTQHCVHSLTSYASWHWPQQHDWPESRTYTQCICWHLIERSDAYPPDCVGLSVRVCVGRTTYFNFGLALVGVAHLDARKSEFHARITRCVRLTRTLNGVERLPNGSEGGNRVNTTSLLLIMLTPTTRKCRIS